MRALPSALLLALLGPSCWAAHVGWECPFDSADFGDGKYAPLVADGVAHYTLEHGYIGNVQQEFPAVSLAEHPFFGIRARNLKGGIFVKFRVDGQWQKDWVIANWTPEQMETRHVDLRRYGGEVSGVWLNSQSSTDGAEWLLDWMGLVKSDNPLNVSIVTAGGRVTDPTQRALNFNLRCDLDAAARVICTVRGLPPDGEFIARQPVSTAPGQMHNVGMRVPAREGARYELSLADQDTGALYYQAILSVPTVLQVRMIAPGYRNAIYATEQVDEIRLGWRLNILPPTLRGLTLHTRLQQGERVIAQTETASSEFVAETALPAAGLAPGEYVVHLEARHGEQVLGHQALPLHVYPPHPNEVRVDADLALRVKGEPFLPVGFYSVPLKHLQTVAEAGFNSVLTYDSGTESLQGYLEEAERVGLKAVVHSPAVWFREDGERKLREAVAALRDKPGLLGWYLIDEPSSGNPGQTPEDLARLYALMQELDPYHPTFTVYCRPEEFALYRDTHDVFLCDPYPVGNRPLDFVAEWTEQGKQAMEGKKPVVIVPQSFGSEEGPQTWWRLPTAQEAICMGYLALVHGARGLLYYRYDVQQYDRALADQGKWPWPTIGYLPELRPETWAGFERLGPQLRELAPVIFAPEQEAQVSVSPDDCGLHVALRQHEGATYLIAVNPSEEAVDAAITVGGLVAGAAEVVFEGRRIPVNDGTFGDRFEGAGVHVYRFR